MVETNNREYTFQYKCRRCGMLVDGCSSVGTTMKAMGQLLEVLTSGSYRPEGCGMSVDAVDIHHCDCGGLGVTDLVGVQFKEEGE